MSKNSLTSPQKNYTDKRYEKGSMILTSNLPLVSGVKPLLRRLIKQGGKAALKKQITSNHRHKNRTDEALEKLLINFSLQNPHLGQVQVSALLKVNHGVEISANGVRSVWLRENMNTCALRLHRSQSLPK